MKTCPQCQIKYPDVLEFCPRDGSPLPAAPGNNAADFDPILGTTIDGRYAIESRLGEGGMGVVYKARHVLIDKPVAIKILRKEAAQDTAAVQRFIQEAKSASKINHSNIVDITDFGVLADGHAYFVMEFLQGQTLSQIIQDGPMDPARVCSIGAQMARGLHAAHTKGIVHRDLKPENIFLLEREGQQDFVKIVDFGIAKVGSGQKLTQVGMVLGTPEYMSPEQATGQETDHRVDQYAVGCIMYEMLTGAVPFLGERPAQTLTKHVFEPVQPPRKRKPELNIPASLEAVVLRTLEKKSEKRFPSMRDLEQALMQVDGELRSGRVVVDDLRGGDGGQSAPISKTPSERGVAAAVPPAYPPAPPGYPAPAVGAVPQYPPAPIGTPYYPPGAAPPPSYPQAGYPPGVAPGGPYLAQTPGVSPGSDRPTNEGQVVRTRRVRSILAAVAGALIVVIALLIYFLVNKPGQPRPVVVPPHPLTPEPVNPPPSPPPVVPPSKPPGGSEAPSLVEVQIISKPPGAEVLINGEPHGTTPLKLSQQPGVTVRLEVRKKGFEPYDEELQVTKNQEVAIKLKPEHGGKGGKGGKTGKGGKGGKPGNEDGGPRLPGGLRNPFGDGDKRKAK